MRGQIVTLALEDPELSSQELAVKFTDKKNYFVSEASVYRLLKSHDMITSPACDRQSNKEITAIEHISCCKIASPKISYPGPSGRVWVMY